MSPELSRRDFLKSTALAGAGLTLRFTIPGVDTASAAASFEPNAALTITPDGFVTVHITKAEMGQGVGTALAQIVAEELEADWKDIRIDYPMNDPKFGLMLTGGSWSVNWTFDSLSRAGAGARMLLIEAAAKQMGVAAADCVAADSRVRHLPTGRSMAYGEIVAKVPITRTLSEEDLKKIALKKPSQYRIVGTWIPRLDIPEKTNGRAKFGIDTFLPGMVYAKVAYPPTREGGKHTSVDDSAAKRVKGYIRTVVNDDIVAVVADTYENAVKARDALKVTWNPGSYANVSTESIFAEYARKAKEDTTSPAWVEQGDIRSGMAEAVRTHEATFTTDYVAHMQMEPMNCVVRFENGVYDIYTGSQFQTMAVGTLSKKLGVEESKIRIHQHYLGGGFGRRLEPDVILEGALIAREVKRPVKLIRSREEDLRRDYYRSATLQVLKGGLGANGKIVAWQNTLVAAYPGERYGGLDDKGRDQFSLNGSDHVYDVPNQFVRAIRSETGISVGYVRAVAPNYTFFAVETFMDELAHLAGVDPVAFRLSMLGSTPRLASVLKLAAEKGGWGTPLPPNVGRGVACVTAQEKKSPTWTASVVEAQVDPTTGRVRVRRVTCAVDCGIVVNPDGARAQIEGSVLFGVSNALKEYGTVANGALVQSNFHDYHVLRMDEVPDVEIHVVDSTEYPTGLGEPGTTTIAPALSNAIFAATGARVRSVPLLPSRVLKAIQQKA
ncbi:MAG: xanthine dehydrogenase family protein molybdopterin-binding subunit [Candidatus Rokuibacteriota bacterium]|nr:MAG: xanthine dehydrogenase family protein molybdopterin-binding subunit [Candidatus Rokubacteria bacterium]PYN66101.1 MAG: xanthine dehydrogenase family protein molybdopterin-binding subunit [Candidatus Rokubacteria bacterium]